MLEPKVPAVGAAIGFVLSFLIGLLSGASFPGIFIRAAFMAVLFGALAAFGKIVIHRYLPEVFGDRVSAYDSDDTLGSSVDITVGDASESLDSMDAAGVGLTGMVPDFLSNSTASSEGASPVSEQSVSSRASNGSTMASPLERPETSSGSGYTSRQESRETVGGLDVLPDLQDFVPQSPPKNDDDADDEVSSGGGIGIKDSIFVAPDTRGMSEESETMAKAIRTILSRDN